MIQAIRIYKEMNLHKEKLIYKTFFNLKCSLKRTGPHMKMLNV